MPVEVVSSNERITSAEWFRWVQRQGSATGMQPMQKREQLQETLELASISDSIQLSKASCSSNANLKTTPGFPHHGDWLALMASVDPNPR